MNTHTLRRAVVALSTGIALSVSTNAAIVTWQGDVSQFWNNTNNWSSNTLPTTSDVATFTGDASLITQPFVNFNSANLGGRIDFASAGWTLTLNQSASFAFVGVNGGTTAITSTGSGTNRIVQAGAQGLQIQTGNVDVAAGNTLSIEVPLLGSRQITKIGDGALVITKASTRTLPTIINGGLLIVSNPNGSATGSVQVRVQSGTLGGTGIITGDILGYNNGIIAPGLINQIGTLTVSNSIDLGGGTFKMDINKSGIVLTSDLLAGVTTLDLNGGVLDVTATGSAISLGDSWTLFSATTYTNTFSVLNLPSLTGGLAWDTSSLYVNGAIGVVPEPSTVALVIVGAVAVLLLRRRR
jgi:autotransporter-associated beta strand protein